MNAPGPVPVSRIRNEMPDVYGAQSDAAALRMFERDKADLLDMGIPLRHVSTRGGREEGYRIPPSEYALRDLKLTPEEMAVSLLAGGALIGEDVFPFRADLERALQKIRLGAGPRLEAATAPADLLVHDPAVGAGEAIASVLAALSDAVLRRKTATLVYLDWESGDRETRVTDAYGLYCSHGRWYLVGHSHERDAERIFAVHRIESVDVNSRRARTPDFEVPAGFELASWARQKPWDYSRHESMDIVVEVRPDFRWMAERHFGLVPADGKEGWVSFRISASNSEPVLDWVLGSAGKARVVAPESLRKQARSMLTEVLARYGED